MEELQELKGLLQRQHYADALTLVEEMEEMSREDKVNKIKSFLKVLLLHLIKQEAEQKTTRSWDLSIANSVDQIKDTNARQKSGGYYLSEPELARLIDSAFPLALKGAALEAFAGKFTDTELAEKVSIPLIKTKALQMILAEDLL